MPATQANHAWRSSTSRKRIRRWRSVSIAAAVVFSLAAVSLAVLGISSSPTSADEEHQERVLTVTVQGVEAATSYDVPREYVGKVEAERNSDVSFERDGLVVSVEVQEGDAVQPGQVIARMDTKKLEARRAVLEAQCLHAKATFRELHEGPRQEVIAAARADLARWQAEHRLATLTTGRTRKLFKRNAVTAQEWDKARLTEQSLQALVATAQARLDELLNGTRQEQIDAQAALVRQTEAEIHSVDVDLDKSVSTAPYAGVIAARHVDEGEVIAAGTPVVELVEMPQLRVRVGISGLAAESLRRGQTLDVVVRGERQPGAVTAIRPDRNMLTRTVTVLIALDEPPASVKVGDLAKVTLERPMEQQGFWVPISALTEGSRGLWVCYVAVPLRETSDTDATHRVDSRPVELLYETTDRAYVVGPLDAGELLVSEGLHRLVPQQQVVLASEGGDAQ